MHGRVFEVRKAVKEDYDIIIALWTNAGLHHKPYGRDSRENLEREMTDPEVDFLVALEGNHIIGSIIGTNDGRKGWVNRLAVDLDHRGMGIAEDLVEMMEDRFRSRSLKIFSCLINAENGPSRSLFERIGYDRHPEVLYYSKKIDPEV
ncbi:MAG TPA: GNAT family N-acetyltransferase [Methanomassiliicoccales archaeon]|jgi:ribosomal protein S18 acetylase RimI-like enzyme